MSGVAIHGALFVGPYKGYYGKAEYDTDAGFFHGDVSETTDVITFVGSSPAEVAKAFEDSIDDYLEFCEIRGKSPNKPFSGKFLTRVSPKLHHDLTVNAAQAGKSLNQYVVEIL